MRIYDERRDRAIVWDNYKAGVMNTANGDIIVPIRYDEIHWRIRSFRSPGPGIPPPPIEMAGFACFTDEGEAVAYDFDGNEDTWKDWEESLVNPNPERPSERSAEDIEKDILSRYHFDIKREEIEDLLLERRNVLNYDWKHTPENAKLVSAVNDKLNEAVHEALQLAEEAEKLVKGRSDQWCVEVEVYPEWEDPEHDNASAAGALFNIRNIIAELGRRSGFKSASPCFEWWNSSEVDNGWDFKTATLDDGVSWDEGSFRRPAYMDCYFLHPFQELFFDNYLFAIQDLLTIKSFYINVLINKAVAKK